MAQIEAAISKADVPRIEASLTLLEKAVDIHKEMESEEELERVGQVTRRTKRRLSSLVEALRKAMEGEGAVQEGDFGKAALAFSGSKIDFETAGCDEYASMAEKKRDLSLKHARATLKHNPHRRKMGEPPLGSRPDPKIDPAGAARWDEEQRRYLREQEELDLSHPDVATEDMYYAATEASRRAEEMAMEAESRLKNALSGDGSEMDDIEKEAFIERLRREVEEREAEALMAELYASDLRLELKEKKAKERAMKKARDMLPSHVLQEMEWKKKSRDYYDTLKKLDLRLIPKDGDLVWLADKADFEVVRVDQIRLGERIIGVRLWLLAEESLQRTGGALEIVRLGEEVLSTSSSTGLSRSVHELFVLLRYYRLRERELEALAWRTEYTQEELSLLLEEVDERLMADASVCQAYAQIPCPAGSLDPTSDRASLGLGSAYKAPRFVVSRAFS